MNAINLPVRPPTRPRALDTFLAAPAIAGPAAEVTRDRPSVALVLYSAAVFLAPSAVCFACWEAVLSNRRAATLRSTLVRRISGRARAEDILCAWVWGGRWNAEAVAFNPSFAFSARSKSRVLLEHGVKNQKRSVHLGVKVEPLFGGGGMGNWVGWNGRFGDAQLFGNGAQAGETNAEANLWEKHRKNRDRSGCWNFIGQ